MWAKKENRPTQGPPICALQSEIKQRCTSTPLEVWSLLITSYEAFSSLLLSYFTTWTATLSVSLCFSHKVWFPFIYFYPTFSCRRYSTIVGEKVPPTKKPISKKPLTKHSLSNPLSKKLSSDKQSPISKSTRPIRPKKPQSQTETSNIKTENIPPISATHSTTTSNPSPKKSSRKVTAKEGAAASKPKSEAQNKATPESSTTEKEILHSTPELEEEAQEEGDTEELEDEEFKGASMESIISFWKYIILLITSPSSTSSDYSWQILC